MWLGWEMILRSVRTVWRWVYRLRSVILAIPVAVIAVLLAVHNMTNLPEIVSINTQVSGEYTYAIARSVAVMGPLALTAVCLLLQFCSKRVLYPWLISVFSLVIPLAFLFTSAFI